MKIIDDTAFSLTQNLKFVDLSDNSLFGLLPKSLLQLPNLQTLHLARATLVDSDFKNIDVRAPLLFLQVADNILTRIPDTQSLTSLQKLNVSNNDISHISTEDIAQMCSLKDLDITGNKISFDEFPCECHVLRTWTENRGIKVRPALDCSVNRGEECSSVEFSNKTMVLYRDCVDKQASRIETKKTFYLWIMMAIFVIVFVIGCIGMTCYIHRQNQIRIEKWRRDSLSMFDIDESTLTSPPGRDKAGAKCTKMTLLGSNANLD